MKCLCPKCGSDNVAWDTACHTWPNERAGGVFYACIGCDSARKYICMEKGCDWRYTHGLNPDNPRFGNEQKSKPVWVDDAWLGQTWQDVPDGMRYYWDD